jgi:hypothetical protein
MMRTSGSRHWSDDAITTFGNAGSRSNRSWTFAHGRATISEILQVPAVMSGFGTRRTYPHVRVMSAIEGDPDIQWWLFLRGN